jgi:hypothetical protein
MLFEFEQHALCLIKKKGRNTFGQKDLLVLSIICNPRVPELVEIGICYEVKKELIFNL